MGVVGTVVAKFLEIRGPLGTLGLYASFHGISWNVLGRVLRHIPHGCVGDKFDSSERLCFSTSRSYLKPFRTFGAPSLAPQLWNNMKQARGFPALVNVLAFTYVVRNAHVDESVTACLFGRFARIVLLCLVYIHDGHEGSDAAHRCRLLRAGGHVL